MIIEEYEFLIWREGDGAHIAKGDLMAASWMDATNIADEIMKGLRQAGLRLKVTRVEKNTNADQYRPYDG